MADDAKSPARKKRRSSVNVEEDDGGFKFTRQSRRTTTYYKGSTKKRRRSSFVHGRKERKSLAPPSSKINLHQNIPVGLPPSARLRRLFHASLELAITKIKEQPNTIQSDYPDFQEEAQDAFLQLQRMISESDVIVEAFQMPSQEMNNDNTLPNPRNQQLEESALNCRVVSEKLQQEHSKWDELLRSYHQLQDTTKQELQEWNDTSKNKEKCPDFLSSTQHKLLSGKPTLKSMLDKLEKVKHTSELQVDKICQSISNLKQYGDAAERNIQHKMEIFGAKSVQVIKDMGTPRTLIRGQQKRH